MPIEVRELVIKATVTQEGTAATGARSAASNNSVSAPEEIINTCVERVLEILRDKMER
jgi:Family of unknown function (DUF5908)